GQIVMADDNNNSIRAANNSTTITNGADHTIRGSGLILANVGGFVNEGAIYTDGTAGLRIDPGLLPFENLGVVGGIGMLTFSDDFDNAGTIAAGLPEDRVGMLSIFGDVTNTSTATLAVEIASGTADLVAVDGSVSLDGMLTVSLLSGLPGSAAEFTVLTATDGVTGNFSNAIADTTTGIATGVQFGALTFDVTYFAGSVVISNVVPTPATAALLAIAGLTATRRRRS
ncbi:MAG: hypothetical protein AAF235_04995, partial [Planctomycetota bacterium]